MVDGTGILVFTVTAALLTGLSTANLNKQNMKILAQSRSPLLQKLAETQDIETLRTVVSAYFSDTNGDHTE